MAKNKGTNGGGVAVPAPPKPPTKSASRTSNAKMKSPSPSSKRKDFSQAPMQRFEILGGKHHGPGSEDVDMWHTVPGQPNVVESVYPLDEMFANKFRRLTGPTRLPRDFDPTFDQTTTTDVPLALQEQAARQAEENPGDGEQDEASLGPATKVERYRRTGATARGRQGDQTAERQRIMTIQGEEDDEEDPQVSRAEGGGGEDTEEEDVSDQFPKAEEGGFQVFKSKHGYVVRDKKEGDLVGGEDYIPNKTEVNRVIKENTKAE